MDGNIKNFDKKVGVDLSNLKGDKRLSDETYDEYILRRTQEQNQIDEHLKGCRLKKDEIGSQRLQYLQKKIKRGTLQR